MASQNPNDQLQAALRQALSEQSFNSLEDVQAFSAQWMAHRNQAAATDFQGLSSQQMHLMLYTPWAAPDFIEAPSVLAHEPQAPVTTLLQILFDAIGEKGLKPTATGNLPRQLCRQAALQLWGEEEYAERTRYGGINQEHDFLELHLARVLAEDTGLIRKYKGRFIISSQGRTLLKNGMRAIYPRLLRHYVSHFHWDYAHRLDGLPIIQMASCFTLYLLSLHGRNWQSNFFYEDAFVQAFPAAVTQMPVVSYTTQEKALRQDYFYRTLYHFATYFGLAEVQVVNDDFLTREYRVKATPLLSQVIRFRVTPSPA
jgi:hypothetical protein